MKKISMNRLLPVTLVAGLGLGGCTINNYKTTGEYDDVYGTSADAPVVVNRPSRPSMDDRYGSQSPSYDDRYDRPVDATTQAADEEAYYDENYVTSRGVRRNPAGVGYSDSYAQGYREGWNDFAWSQPMGWASPFNRFSYDPWFGSGWNSWGMNSFGWNSWGFSPFRPGLYISMGFGSPWGWNAFNSPWGWNSFGMNNWGWNSFYDPWGWNAFNSPWGWNGFGMNPWNYGYNMFGPSRWGGMFAGGMSPYYNNQPVYYNNNAGVGANRYATRTYGSRTEGSNPRYNDRFDNTPRTGSSAANSARRASGSDTYGRARTTDGYSSPTNSGSPSGVTTRRSGGWVGNDGSYSRPSGSETSRGSSDTYSRGGGSNTTSGGREVYSRPSSSDSYNRSGGTYSRSAENSRSYTPSRSSGSSDNYSRPSSSPSSSSRGSSWGGGSSSSGGGSYSRGSSSPSPSSSGGGGGGYSRGSSGSSGSSGGGSRGPR